MSDAGATADRVASHAPYTRIRVAPYSSPRGTGRRGGARRPRWRRPPPARAGCGRARRRPGARGTRIWSLRRPRPWPAHALPGAMRRSTRSPRARRAPPPARRARVSRAAAPARARRAGRAAAPAGRRAGRGRASAACGWPGAGLAGVLRGGRFSACRLAVGGRGRAGRACGSGRETSQYRMVPSNAPDTTSSSAQGCHAAAVTSRPWPTSAASSRCVRTSYTWPRAAQHRLGQRQWLCAQTRDRLRPARAACAHRTPGRAPGGARRVSAADRARPCGRLRPWADRRCAEQCVLYARRASAAQYRCSYVQRAPSLHLPFPRQTSQEALERDPRRPPGGKRATGERSAPCRSGRAQLDQRVLARARHHRLLPHALQPAAPHATIEDVA